MCGSVPEVTATVARSPSAPKQKAGTGGFVSKMKLAIFTDGSRAGNDRTTDLNRDLAASDSQMYSGLQLDWIAAVREINTQKKSYNLRLDRKKKSIIAGTFIG